MVGGFDDTSNFDKEFTDINISIVSIEGVTICKHVPEEGKDTYITTTTVAKSSQKTEIQKQRRGSRPSMSGVNDVEIYKDFNFFDPSFRQSYLTGNASLLPDDYHVGEDAAFNYVS
jgi:hypothetical protein